MTALTFTLEEMAEFEALRQALRLEARRMSGCMLQLVIGSALQIVLVCVGVWLMSQGRDVPGLLIAGTWCGCAIIWHGSRRQRLISEAIEQRHEELTRWLVRWHGIHGHALPASLLLRDLA